MATTAAGFVSDTVRKASESAFKAQQRNRRETAFLHMREHKLDKEKMKARFLAGKRKRLIESGVTQLFVTSGHSPAARSPEGPRDKDHETSPYFSDKSNSKIDEKRLLKWRMKERQFERSRKNEEEDMSPWARAEKEAENKRVMNQLAYIIDNSHKGFDIYNQQSQSQEKDADTNVKDDADKSDGKKQEKTMINLNEISTKYRQNRNIDAFEVLKKEQLKHVENPTQNYIGMKKRDDSFNFDEWEKYATAKYSSNVTKPVKYNKAIRRVKSAPTPTTKIRTGIDHSSKIYTAEVNHLHQKEPKVKSKDRLECRTMKNHETVSGKYYEDTETVADCKTESKMIVRPHSAIGSSRKTVAKRKRIKSAGEVRNTTTRPHSLSGLNTVKETKLESSQDCEVFPETSNANQSLVSPYSTNGSLEPLYANDSLDDINGMFKSVVKIPRESENAADSGFNTDYSPSQESVELFTQSETKVLPEKTSSLEKQDKLKSTHNKKTTKKSNVSLSNARTKNVTNKKKAKSLKSYASQSTTSSGSDKNTAIAKHKKKKFITKIEELRDLYEDDLSDSEEDDDELEKEAHGVTTRISQWKKDLMREAPPGIYSVNAPIKIRLAVSKSQLQKDLDRMVEEHISDLKVLSDKEHARRLKSRLHVYMTMKIVEKAVNGNVV